MCIRTHFVWIRIQLFFKYGSGSSFKTFVKNDLMKSFLQLKKIPVAIQFFPPGSGSRALHTVDVYDGWEAGHLVGVEFLLGDDLPLYADRLVVRPQQTFHLL